MRSEFTAVYEPGGDWIVAWCPEVPGANGQGRTKDEAHESLAAAIALILEDRREEGLRGVPDDAEREIITVEVRGPALTVVVEQEAKPPAPHLRRHGCTLKEEGEVSRRSQFPPGWDEGRVRRVLERYESQEDVAIYLHTGAVFLHTAGVLRIAIGPPVSHEQGRRPCHRRSGKARDDLELAPHRLDRPAERAHVHVGAVRITNFSGDRDAASLPVQCHRRSAETFDLQPRRHVFLRRPLCPDRRPRRSRGRPFRRCPGAEPDYVLTRSLAAERFAAYAPVAAPALEQRPQVPS